MGGKEGESKTEEQILFFFFLDNLFSVELSASTGMCKSLSSLSLSASLQPSLSPHRQGRSFSVSAHTPLGRHQLESTDTELIERAEGSSFLERR